MHVGIVTYTDIDYGLDLANAFNKVHVSVSLYLSRRQLIPALGSPDQLAERVYDLGLLHAAVRLYLYQLPRMRDPRSFAGVRRLSQSMRDEGVDVAHIMMGGGEIWLAVLAYLLRRFRDIPVASTMLVPRPNPGEGLPRVVQSVVNKLLTYGSDVIIANGRKDFGLVQKLYRVPESRISYLQLGPRTTAARWATKTVPEEPGTILFFGKIKRYKGLEYLVRAQPIITRHVPQARIVIAGSGKEELERCRQMIQDSNRFEIYDGFVPSDVVPELFQRASLVVLPYTSASTSGILVTAYVFGKPVVVTRVGSLPEYVEDGVTGLLVPPADVEQLADAIVRLLSDDALRHRMGKNATRWVSEEQKKTAMQSLRAYEQAISIHHT